MLKRVRSMTATELLDVLRHGTPATQFGAAQTLERRLSRSDKELADTADNVSEVAVSLLQQTQADPTRFNGLHEAARAEFIMLIAYSLQHLSADVPQSISADAVIELVALLDMSAAGHVSQKCTSRTARMAARALANLAAAPGMPQTIVDAGAVPFLVALLERRETEDGECSAKDAANALGSLVARAAEQEPNEEENETVFHITACIYKAGALEPLMDLVALGEVSAAASEASNTLANMVNSGNTSIEWAILTAFETWGRAQPVSFPRLMRALSMTAKGFLDGARKWVALYEPFAPQASLVVPPMTKLINKTDTMPEEYACSITCEPMTDPVLLVGDGRTYERAAITKWLHEHRGTSPFTNLPLSESDQRLIPNMAVRSIMEKFAEKQGATDDDSSV
jgi:hypothetical protein